MKITITIVGSKPPNWDILVWKTETDNNGRFEKKCTIPLGSRVSDAWGKDRLKMGVAYWKKPPSGYLEPIKGSTGWFSVKYTQEKHSKPSPSSQQSTTHTPKEQKIIFKNRPDARALVNTDTHARSSDL